MAAKLKRPPRKPFGARHLDGTSPWSIIANPDPKKKYVWANRELGNLNGGPDYYSMLGWEVVRKSAEKEGEDLAAGSTCKVGDPLESQGNVLMSMDAEEWERQRQEGHDLGATGMAAHAALMEHIIDRGKTGFDPIRGIQGLRRSDGRPYVTSVNEISPIEAESFD